jgi:hypothetical protein
MPNIFALEITEITYSFAAHPFSTANMLRSWAWWRSIGALDG